MMFVLDGSGSMSQNNKWTAITGALNAIFDDMATKADPSIGAGLLVFSDFPNDQTGGSGPYPQSNDVPIAFVSPAQDTALKGRIAPPDGPGGGTPTYAALTGGYSELEAFTPAAPLQANGKKVLVIMTDGVPTDGSNAQCISSAGTELTKAAPQGPITTFVIGTGQFPSPDLTNFDPTFLGQLAQAGGAAPAGCNPTENTDVTKVCYFEVDPTTASASQVQQQFVNAINTIRGAIASCTFQLQNTGNIDPTKVNVVFNNGQGGGDQVIPQDPNNGWTYDNPGAPTEVILHGSACDNLKNDPQGSIHIVLGCKTIVH
jgi:hypothetical protein